MWNNWEGALKEVRKNYLEGEKLNETKENAVEKPENNACNWLVPVAKRIPNRHRVLLMKP